METYEFFARCPAGFEAELAAELKTNKIKRIRPLKGGVAFFGTLAQGYRACLWSRCASRVLLILDRFSSRNAEELYEGVQSIDWSKHLNADTSLAIHARGTNEELRNTQFVAVKAKDAICDQIRDLCDRRPDVVTYRPDVQIDITLREDKATISIDLAGESLHRRGYRMEGEQNTAPIKEALAAGILLKSGWDTMARDQVARDQTEQNQSLCFDPLCGSGTFVIEAGMIAADMAPGLLRDYWGFMGWLGHDENLWHELLDEADERLEEGLKHMPYLVGADIDAAAIELALSNAKRVGLSNYLIFRQADVRDMETTLKKCIVERGGTLPSKGLVVTNPPYAQRLFTQEELPSLYTDIARGLQGIPHGWKLSIITPDAALDSVLGLTPDVITQVYNGGLEATLRQYVVKETNACILTVSSLADGVEREVIIAEKTSEQFAARLRKVAKVRRKWAAKENISCYRLYDADLPDYSVAIDCYQSTSSEEMYLCISEYQAPKTIDPAKAQRRYHDVMVLAPAILGVSPKNVFSKVRKQARGGGQYRREERQSFKINAQENGFKFELDLSGYLDTGLFLDHRLTRELVGSLSSGKTFLNLFAYTGAASVYAAGGGAYETTTVDLSQTYLDWAERNMRLNGFRGNAHHFIRADVVQWITEERRSPRRYDLIFVDPPTFSNSKAMGNNTWSVQRDHVELLIGVSRLLEPEGKAVFSCNFRGFKIDAEQLEKYGVTVKDISQDTIPEDFSRNPRIHKCYIVERAITTV